jgi:hypothetical protein
VRSIDGQAGPAEGYDRPAFPKAPLLRRRERSSQTNPKRERGPVAFPLAHASGSHEPTCVSSLPGEINFRLDAERVPLDSSPIRAGPNGMDRPAEDAELTRVAEAELEVKVDDNDFVEKGDLLVRLDEALSKVRVSQAEAALEAARKSDDQLMAMARSTMATAKANRYRLASAISEVRNQLAGLRVARRPSPRNRPTCDGPMTSRPGPGSARPSSRSTASARAWNCPRSRRPASPTTTQPRPGRDALQRPVGPRRAERQPRPDRPAAAALLRERGRLHLNLRGIPNVLAIRS